MFLRNIVKNRIGIKGHNIPSGSNEGVSSPDSVTHIDISERDEALWPA